MVCAKPLSLYSQKDQGHLPHLQVRQTEQNPLRQLHWRQTPNRPHCKDQQWPNHRRVLWAALQTQNQCRLQRRLPVRLQEPKVLHFEEGTHNQGQQDASEADHVRWVLHHVGQLGHPNQVRHGRTVFGIRDCNWSLRRERQRRVGGGRFLVAGGQRRSVGGFRILPSRIRRRLLKILINSERIHLFW